MPVCGEEEEGGDKFEQKLSKNNKVYGLKTIKRDRERVFRSTATFNTYMKV